MNSPTDLEVCGIRNKLAKSFNEDVAQSVMVKLLSIDTSNEKLDGYNLEAWSHLCARNIIAHERRKYKVEYSENVDAYVKHDSDTTRELVEAREILCNPDVIAVAQIVLGNVKASKLVLSRKRKGIRGLR